MESDVLQLYLAITNAVQTICLAVIAALAHQQTSSLRDLEGDIRQVRTEARQR